MNRLLSWMRYGLLDLRGDLRRFGVLIACLALGTSVIAAVGSVGSGLKTTMERNATALMGADLEVWRSDHVASVDEVAFLETLGEVARVVDANARAASSNASALLDLMGASDNYPMIGNVISPQLERGDKPSTLLAAIDGQYGAIVDAVLLDRLGIAVGDRFSIGRSEFVARGTLVSLPDGAVRGFKLGLTVLISTEALNKMTDLSSPLPGLVPQYRYKVLLDGIGVEQATAEIAENLTDSNWNVRTPRDAAGALVLYYDLFSRFLLIVGLSSLLVGGVGVSNSVSAYVAGRQRSIAILRSLGATGPRILVHFLTQIGVLVAIGVGIGVLAGAAATLVIMPVVGQALNVSAPAFVEPVPLLIATGFGFLAGFAYSYLPLVQAQKISPALLFRSNEAVLPPPHWRTMMQPPVLVPVFLSVAGILWLAVVTTNDVALVGYYALGSVLAFLLLQGFGQALQVFLRAMPPFPTVGIRNALRNIYAPGSTATMVIVSIGLGLTMLLIIVLLQGNLRNQLLGAVTSDAPTFVASDMFDDEVERLEQMVGQEPGLTLFESAPMLGGTIISVNGRDPSEFANLPPEAAYLLSAEIPVTWQADLPEAYKISEGEWWPTDYSGEPLISLNDTLKSQLGLEVGDTLQIALFGEINDVTIANFTDYRWQQGINFLVTFSPGLVEAYPATYLGSVYAARGSEKDIERYLARDFSDIAFIPIGDALNQLAGVLGTLGLAVSVVAGLAVINGLLVLAGALAAVRKQREADAVIQKVLGATRFDILKVFIFEYGLISSFTAAIATVIGVAAAWAVTQGALDVEFSADPLQIVLLIGGAILATIAAGAFTTWRALSTRPAQFLRVP